MTDHVFVCPECAQRIEVNEPMRAAILSNGCPVCTARITAENFCTP